MAMIGCLRRPVTGSSGLVRNVLLRRVHALSSPSFDFLNSLGPPVIDVADARTSEADQQSRQAGLGAVAHEGA